MPDHETIRVYDDRATDYAGMGEDYAADPRLADFIKACKPMGRVLDLGCGPGASALVMAQSGLVVDATDASSEMVAMAGNHAGVSARQATFDDIAGEAIYDGIWANFSLLHAPRSDFPRHLAALHSALKPGGAFYICMKLGIGEARDAIGRLYTYYTAQELDSYLAEAGFGVLSHKCGNSIGLDGSQADWISVATHG